MSLQASADALIDEVKAAVTEKLSGPVPDLTNLPPEFASLINRENLIATAAEAIASAALIPSNTTTEGEQS